MFEKICMCKGFKCRRHLLIYKVMIRPHFDYGDYMIDSGTQKNIDKLERIQNRFVRTIEYKSTEKRENIDALKS